MMLPAGGWCQISNPSTLLYIIQIVIVYADATITYPLSVYKWFDSCIFAAYADRYGGTGNRNALWVSFLSILPC